MSSFVVGKRSPKTMYYWLTGEIAYSRGFNDSAHFSRAFKDRFGVSPREFRMKAGRGVLMDG